MSFSFPDPVQSNQTRRLVSTFLSASFKTFILKQFYKLSIFHFFFLSVFLMFSKTHSLLLLHILTLLTECCFPSIPHRHSMSLNTVQPPAPLHGSQAFFPPPPLSCEVTAGEPCDLPASCLYVLTVVCALTTSADQQQPHVEGFVLKWSDKAGFTAVS